MKHAIHLLLAFTLVVAPFGCNRDVSEDAVSANSDNLNPPAAAPPAPASTAKSSTSRETPSRERVEVETEVAERDVEPETQRAQTTTTASTATLPAGTAITVVMSDRLSTEENTDGDTFTASLLEPIVVNNRVLAERGATVQGRVQNIEQPGKVKGRARMELVLTKLTTGGKTYDIDTEPFVAVAEDNKGRDAATIAGGAGVGAAIGAIAGGKKGAAIGAIIGGGTGTTAVLVTKGEDMKIEPETRVNFVTERDLRLPVLRQVIS